MLRNICIIVLNVVLSLAVYRFTTVILSMVPFIIPSVLSCNITVCGNNFNYGGTKQSQSRIIFVLQPVFIYIYNSKTIDGAHLLCFCLKPACTSMRLQKIAMCYELYSQSRILFVLQLLLFHVLNYLSKPISPCGYWRSVCFLCLCLWIIILSLPISIMLFGKIVLSSRVLSCGPFITYVHQ